MQAPPVQVTHSICRKKLKVKAVKKKEDAGIYETLLPSICHVLMHALQIAGTRKK